MLILLLSLTATPDPLLAGAVREAIEDEIEFAIEATIDQDIDRYMETVPYDTLILEDDGTTTDRDRLRELQLQAWAIIPRTNSIAITVTGFELGCDGECATVRTDQHWDRQMIGRDGVTEFNVVTTQQHIEHWEVRDSRWVQVTTEELGGTTMVDGQPY